MLEEEVLLSGDERLVVEVQGKSAACSLVSVNSTTFARRSLAVALPLRSGSASVWPCSTLIQPLTPEKHQPLSFPPAVFVYSLCPLSVFGILIADLYSSREAIPCPCAILKSTWSVYICRYTIGKKIKLNRCRSTYCSPNVHCIIYNWVSQVLIRIQEQHSRPFTKFSRSIHFLEPLNISLVSDSLRPITDVE